MKWSNLIMLLPRSSSDHPFVTGSEMLLGCLFSTRVSIKRSSLWRRFRRTLCLGDGQAQFLLHLGLGIRQLPKKARYLVSCSSSKDRELKVDKREVLSQFTLSKGNSKRVAKGHTANVPAPHALPPLTSLRSANNENVFLYPKGT